nr:hypothetical protein [Tanacetum cinerariifolium]
MGRDTVQLETAVSTISQEYLLEFTSEYGISEDLHPELPGPEERIVDFPEGKTGTHPRAAHEVPLLTVTASRVIEMEDPTAATDSSGVPSTIEVPPPENVTTTGVAPEAGLAEETADMGPRVIKEHYKRGNDGVDTNAPPKVLRRDHVDSRPTHSTIRGKSLAAMGLGMGSTFLVPSSQDMPVDVSDPDPLSFANLQSIPIENVAQHANISYSPRHRYFSELRHLHNDDFLKQYNINLAWQVAMGSQLQLRFEQEAKLLKKSVAQVAHRDQRIQARENEIKNLEAPQEAETDMKKTAGAKNAELGKELENLHALFSDLQVSNDHLSHQVEHGKANLDLEDIEAYNPEADTKYVAALHALRDLKYPMVDQLESLKDAPIDIPVYLEARDPKDPWAFKEEILLANVIAANISRTEKKKKYRV